MDSGLAPSARPGMTDNVSMPDANNPPRGVMDSGLAPSARPGMTDNVSMPDANNRTAWGYGFRARAFAAPRNDGEYEGAGRQQNPERQPAPGPGQTRPPTARVRERRARPGLVP